MHALDCFMLQQLPDRLLRRERDAHPPLPACTSPGGSSNGSLALAQWFDSLNEGPLWERVLETSKQCDIISMSHFLPHQVKGGRGPHPPLTSVAAHVYLAEATMVAFAPSEYCALRPCCQALIPEKRYLIYPNLMKVVGSLPLAQRLSLLAPDISIFGHTHFAWDAYVDGEACARVGGAEGGARVVTADTAALV